MDTGFAQVISPTLTGIASIVAAVIAGYFTVRAAHVKAGEKTHPKHCPLNRTSLGQANFFTE